MTLCSQGNLNFTTLFLTTSFFLLHPSSTGLPVSLLSPSPASEFSNSTHPFCVSMIPSFICSPRPSVPASFSCTLRVSCLHQGNLPVLFLLPRSSLYSDSTSLVLYFCPSPTTNCVGRPLSIFSH